MRLASLCIIYEISAYEETVQLVVVIKWKRKGTKTPAKLIICAMYTGVAPSLQNRHTSASYRSMFPNYEAAENTSERNFSPFVN